MLSHTIEKTVEALNEAQMDGAPLDLSGQAELIKVMKHWQALAIQLECKPAPSARTAWRPEIVAGTDHTRPQNQPKNWKQHEH